MTVFTPTGPAIHVRPSAAELEHWLVMAAALDPDACVLHEGIGFSVDVPTDETWYLQSAFFTRIGNNTPMFFFREPTEETPYCPLPGGTHIESNGISTGAHIYVIKPALVRDLPAYRDPRGLCFERLSRLKHLTLFQAHIPVPAGFSLGANYNFDLPNDFEKGLIAHSYTYDTAWTALASSTLGSIIEWEVSDDHITRTGTPRFVAFKRSVFPQIRTRNASVSGAFPGTSVAGVSGAFYYKLPSDW